MTKPATTEENRRIREAGSPGTWDHGRQVVRSAIDGDICYPDYPENATLIAHAVNQLIPLSEERDMLERDRDDWMATAERLREEVLTLDRLRQRLRESVVKGFERAVAAYEVGVMFSIHLGDEKSRRRALRSRRILRRYASLVRENREPAWVTKAIFGEE